MSFYKFDARLYYENLIPISPTEDHMELREGSNEDEALHVDGIVLFDQLMLKPRSPLLL